MQLTIAIPTYNRNDALRRTVEALLPQLGPECELLIIDNCSPKPVAETLADLLPPAQRRMRVVRNAANIGMNANLVRCHELCNTEYLWTLSDDDLPKPDAVQIIREHITRYPECVFFNFCAEGLFARERTVLTNGLDELIGESEKFFLLLMSINVYKNTEIVPYLNVGYHYAYSFAGFLAMLFLAVRNRAGVCCLSQQVLVAQNLAVPAKHLWSRLSLALGLMTLLELPLGPRSRKAIWAKAREFIYSPEALVYQLLLLTESERDPQLGLYLFDQISFKLAYFSWNPLTRLKRHVYRLFFLFPKLSMKMIRRCYRTLKGRCPDEVIQERFKRE
jgi:glycosyltransferase involved in cell wall biosynthesis